MVCENESSYRHQSSVTCACSGVHDGASRTNQLAQHCSNSTTQLVREHNISRLILMTKSTDSKVDMIQETHIGFGWKKDENVKAHLIIASSLLTWKLIWVSAIMLNTKTLMHVQTLENTKKENRIACTSLTVYVKLQKAQN